jgi:hypothetical protein
MAAAGGGAPVFEQWGKYRVNVTPGGLLGTAPRTKAIAVLVEVALEDRLNHQTQGGLHHPIPHRGDAQGARFGAAGFGDPRPPDRLRAVGTGPKIGGQTRNHDPQPLAETITGHSINARGATIRLHDFCTFAQSLNGLACGVDPI